MSWGTLPEVMQGTGMEHQPVHFFQASQCTVVVRFTGPQTPLMVRFTIQYMCDGEPQPLLPPRSLIQQVEATVHPIKWCSTQIWKCFNKKVKLAHSQLAFINPSMHPPTKTTKKAFASQIEMGNKAGQLVEGWKVSFFGSPWVKTFFGE